MRSPTTTYVDIQDIARETIRAIGYTDADLGFSADSCAVLNAIDKQSPDIAQGVDNAYERRSDASDEDELDVAGAGDQGMMFGYATNETPELMPLPISLAHQLAKRLADVRKDGSLDYLRPDGKTQVSVRYVDGRRSAIEKLLISTQHAEGSESRIKDDLWEHVVLPVLPDDLYDAATAAALVPGQPDRPLRDRRPGGRLRPDRPQDHRRHLRRHGPPRRRRVLAARTRRKVDRSAAYAARYVAKNIVAAGLADRAEVQVAYAIGVAHPVSVHGRDLRHREGRPRSRSPS